MSKEKSIIEKIFTSKADIEEVSKLLAELQKYYTELSDLYSIKTSLVDITDKRRSLAKKLDHHLEEFDDAGKLITDKLYAKLEEAEILRLDSDDLLKKQKEFSDKIDSLTLLLDHKDEEEVLYFDRLSSLISKDSVENLSNKINEINEFSDSLLLSEDEKPNVISATKKAYEDINTLHSEYFSSEDGDTKEEELSKYYTQITKEFNKLINGYTKIIDEEEVSVEPYIKKIKKERER